MTSALFIVPPWWWNTRSGRLPRIEGADSLTSTLMERGSVTRFMWPTFEDGPEVEPTWQAVVEEMRRQMPPGCHVVDTGPAGALSLLAVSGRADVRCLVMGGMFVPPATLRALGMDLQAEGASVIFQTTRTYQVARLNLQGADEDFVKQVGKEMDAGLNWEFTTEFLRSFEALNLLEARPDVRVPVLYVDAPLTATGYAEMAPVLLRLVPNARIESTDLYPATMQDSRTGLEFAEKALAFIDEVERSAAQAG